MYLRSYLHTITTPNKFVRLFSSGAILFSQRLTIRAHCPMDLSDFPMDRQSCPLKVASFGYSSEDVIYEWVKGMSGKEFDNGVLITITEADQHNLLANYVSAFSKRAASGVGAHQISPLCSNI